MKLTVIDYLCLFLFSFVVTVTVCTFIIPPTQRMDFDIYLLVSHVVINHQPLFPLIIGSAIFPFTHPPSLIPFFLPFLFLRTDVAASIWNGLSLIFLITSFIVLTKESYLRIKFPFLLLILSAVLLLEPVRETFLFGQNNTIVLSCLLCCFIFSQKKKKALAGIFLGIAISLKLFPMFLIFYFLAKKQWKVFGVAIGVFVSFLVIGTLGHTEYILQYFQYVKLMMIPIKPIAGDQSFPSFLLFFFPTLKQFHMILTDMVFGIFLLFSFFLWRKKLSSFPADFLFFSEVLAGSVLIITPLAWVHHLVFVIPLSLALLGNIIAKRNKNAFIIFISTGILFFMSGEDSVLFLQQFGLYLPLFYFHALLGIGLVLGGDFLESGLFSFPRFTNK